MNRTDRLANNFIKKMCNTGFHAWENRAILDRHGNPTTKSVLRCHFCYASIPKGPSLKEGSDGKFYEIKKAPIQHIRNGEENE